MYEQEFKSVINGNENSNGYGLSDYAAEFFEQTDETILPEGNTVKKTAFQGYLEASTSIQPYQTLYSCSLKEKENYKQYGQQYSNIFNKKFWVASRYVKAKVSDSIRWL